MLTDYSIVVAYATSMLWVFFFALTEHQGGPFPLREVAKERTPAAPKEDFV
jgi:hypothetical protein